MRMNQGVLKREMDVNKAVLSQPELSQPKGEGKKSCFHILPVNPNWLHLKAHTWQHFPPTFPSICTEASGTRQRHTGLLPKK